ncbi:uncharacterized protein LOC105185778 [Harpegnathos saltator]|uniref:DPY30 domain-containing protein 2 n=1 Tax=Harpegnathos saltator TaxID=610380 RepID=E2BRE6_HARSA|nr:uncharacterized protein LOC105185778 [Harpegnathos saltator]EFN81724.1 DPY30 domain-containing protein 2 [Harpegnathos saltator]
MQEVRDEATFLEEQRENVNFYDEGQRTDESVEEIQAIKEVKKPDGSGGYEEADKNIAAFLRMKSLSEDLVKTLINADLTDEYVRLLRALDFNDDDIGNLRNLWQAKNQISKSNSSSTFDDSLLDVYLSQSSLYLKNVLSKPLIEALREIIATKPADPVEYLGHWLLHFRVCEERSMRKKEEELELLINREKLRMKKDEDKELRVPIEQKEKEEPDEDWNHLHYGESQIDNVSNL